MRDLRIWLLGGFRVSVGDREVAPEEWHLRKSRTLLKLLAMTEGHRLHREQVTALLWSELAPEAAANQLRKALHEARHILDPADTYRHLPAGDELRLARPGTWVDLTAFEQQALLARRTADLGAYRKVIAEYGGDLLPEDHNEPWAAERRAGLRSEYLALLTELARLQEARGDLAGATDGLRRVLAADPLREDAAAALIRVHALAGRRPEALETYQRLHDTLAEELGAEPDGRTQHLYELLRSGPAPAAALWEQVGDLRTIAGDAPGAASAYTAGLAAGPERPGRLHRKAAQAHLTRRRPEAAEPELAAAEQAARQALDPAETGRVAVARAGWLRQTGKFDEARAEAEAALTAAARYGTGRDAAAAGEELAELHHARGAWREGLRLTIEMLGAAADEDAGLGRIFDIHYCLGEYELYGDGPSDSVEDFARATLDLALAKDAGRAQAFAWCLLGEAMMLRGRWTEAAGCLERSATLHDELDPRSGVLPRQRLAELAALRGDSTEATAQLRRGLAMATVSTLAPHALGRLYATAAFDALERGAPGQAVRAVRVAAAAAVRYGDCPTCSAPLNPVAAEACAAVGDRAGAELAARAADQVAAGFAGSAWQAMADTAHGHLALADGDQAGARERFLRAAEGYQYAQQPFWTARAQLQAVLAGGGDPAADRELLAAAELAFDRLGADRALAAVVAAG